MELETVRTFIDVMKLGSFTAVARRRDVDPSSVSRAISSLESELGFRLFQRTTRRLAPTEAGRTWFSRVQKLVEEFEQAGEQALELVSEPAGTLRVTACTSFGQRVLAPLLPEFRARYPKLTLELLLVDHQVDLVAEEIDLAIRFGARPAGDFVATQLTARRFRVCASPAYVAAEGRPQTPHDLTRRNCLLFSMPGYRSRWKFRRNGEASFAVPVTGTLLVSHGLTMTACAAGGLGPALLPDWLCREELENGTLIDLFPDYECTATEFETAAWLVYPGRAYVPRKLRAFIDFLKAEVRGADAPGRQSGPPAASGTARQPPEDSSAFVK